MTDSTWPRRDLSLNERGSLWRQFRNALAQPSWPPGVYVDFATAIAMDNEARPKFLAMQPVFWIPLTDFMLVVPQHPHLQDLTILTRPIFMHEFPFGKDAGGAAAHPEAGPQAAAAAAPPTQVMEEKKKEEEPENSAPDTTMVNGIQ